MSKAKRDFKRVLVISDLHCGHEVGLTPPSWHLRPPTDAPRQVCKTADQREALWKFYATQVKALKPIDSLIVLGDCIDGDGAKTKAVELLVADRKKQALMAIDAINEVEAKDICMIYGTPYHVGQSEDFEKEVAEGVGAKKIEAEGTYNIRGLIVNAKHYIGNATTHAGKKTALNRAQLRNLLWAALDQQPKADLILRGHVHRYEYIEDSLGAAAIAPALQGLGSRYGARQCDGLPVSFGFMCLDVANKNSWRLTPYLLSLKEQASQVTTL